ncbi:MAG: alpha/beta hydrolase [Bacteroidota bacterium]
MGNDGTNCHARSWLGRKSRPVSRNHSRVAREGFQVVAFDGPAHGESEGRQTNPVEFAEAMKKVTDIEGSISAIIAHSFGGVASLLAIQRGLPVTTLINISSPTLPNR